MLVRNRAAGAACLIALPIIADGLCAAPLRTPLPPPRPAELSAPATEAPLPAKAPLPPADPRRERPPGAATASRENGQLGRLPSLALRPWPDFVAEEPELAPPDEICPRLLADARAVVKRVAAIESTAGCGLAEPVRLDAVILDGGAKVALAPAPIMACRMAEATVAHVREDLAAAAVKAGSTLARVLTAAAYECRGRNRVAGAKLSEHAKGNAIDIRGLVLADKRIVGVAPRGMPRPLAEAWRESACARFTTVLGPGSDGYHEDHIHVDLSIRRSGYRICQWNLEAPAEAAAPAAPAAAEHASP